MQKSMEKRINELGRKYTGTQQGTREEEMEKGRK